MRCTCVRTASQRENVKPPLGGGAGQWRSPILLSRRISIVPLPPPNRRDHSATSSGTRARISAGECYQAAGEFALANSAFLDAVETQSKTTAHALSDQRDQAKTLLHQLQSTFRSGH